MLTHPSKTVCLSLISTDLPVWSVMETPATLYQKDSQRFHLVLKAPPVNNLVDSNVLLDDAKKTNPPSPSRVLWLEISPARVIMTMQGDGLLSYRHFWEQGVYGISRYWLPTESIPAHEQIRLRNFTRHLKMTGHPLPESLRIEYELWSQKIRLGHYILNLEIKH
jgi:hypothetical protein